MIKITYQRTLADFANFNIYHVWKSPDRKYFRLLIHYGVPLIVSLMVFLSTMFAGIPVNLANYRGIIIAFAVLVLVMHLLGGRLITSAIRKKIGNSLTPDAVKQLTGDTEVMLTSKEIRMTTPNNTFIKPYPEIVKLRITKGYLFIYIEPLQAIVIPQRAFKNNNEKIEFERQLIKHLVGK